MHLKNLIFLFFLFFLFCYSKKNITTNDTITNFNKPIYQWIITNSNEFTQKIDTQLTKNDIDSILYSIIKKLENNGYPFVNVEFMYDSIIENKVYGKLLVNKGNLTKIDSIAIKGYRAPPSYLIHRFLDIKPNTIYQQKKINTISEKLQINSFVQEYQKNKILFNKNKTILFLYLQKKHNNSLDGFLGLNNNNDTLSIFGKLNLTISNTLNLFETIQVKWNKMTEKSQALEIKTYIPFIFNSIFSINTNFNILQYQHSYTTKVLNSSIELMIRNHFLNLGYSHKSSNVITNNQNNLAEDFKTNLFLLSWQNKKNLFHQKFDYKFLLENRFGIQKIHTNKQQREHIKFNVELVFPLFKKNNFYLSSKNGFLFGNNILENEKMSIGGTNNIRGYLENSFFSKSFGIINLEHKYFFNSNSYFSLFYDIGRLYDSKIKLSSYGLGIALEMEKDIFSINYAIPQYNKVVEFNNAKIHFSYLLKF